MRAPPTTLPPELERARQLVLAHGWNATSYQILNPGLRLWFGEGAVAGYVPAARVLVVAGAPVCSDENLLPAAAALDAFAARQGRRVCYFGAGWRLEHALATTGVAGTVPLGAQPVWDPEQWPAIVRNHPSIRAQLHRARNKEVRVEEWPAGQAHEHPALRVVLHEWLASRGLPPMHFLVEPDTLGRILDRRIFVASRAGSPVAFLLASPVPARQGWLVEQIVRGRRAPNGTSELLIDVAMRTLAASGARYLTLGLSPLSTRAGLTTEPLPRWLRLTFAWVRAHGRRFFDFEGLDAFKAKLRPHAWEPIYALVPGRRFSPADLYAIAGAFGGGSAAAFVARALWRAARMEVEGVVRQA